jgi:UDP-N-acetylglucosamine:LPS N-acetylglucosamine transferase
MTRSEWAGTHAAPFSVLFATIAAGGGHVATANAMAEGLERLHPNAVNTRVSDVMAEFGFEKLDARHKESWRNMLKRPRLVRIGQRLTDAAPALTRAAQNALLNDFAKAASPRIDALKTDLVVANHGWLATALTLARRKHGMRTRVLVFATEPFDASALWAEPRAEWVVAPTLAAKESLVRLGVPASSVAVLGYPVSRAFTEAPAQQAARTALGLEAGFTCLVSLGAEGLAGQALLLTEALLAMEVQVIAVAGRNAELKSALDTLAESRSRLHAVGFTDRMPTLLAASDLVVGKAGPASTMEALAVGRPVIATAYAGLNEERVVRFLQARHLGSYAPSVTALKAEVSNWRDPVRRKQASSTALALDFSGMSTRLAEYIAAVARNEEGSAEPSTREPTGSFETTGARELAGSPATKVVNRT